MEMYSFTDTDHNVVNHTSRGRTDCFTGVSGGPIFKKIKYLHIVL